MNVLLVAWGGLSATLLVLAVLGLRSAREDVAALKTANVNGLLLMVARARQRRWLLRFVQAVVMVALLFASGVHIALGLLTAAALQVLINLDDLTSRVQIDQWQLKEDDHG